MFSAWSGFSGWSATGVVSAARLIGTAGAILLSSCGGDGAVSATGAPVVAAVQPASTPSPTPAASPTAAPSPARAGDGKVVVVSEGSSTAASWSGSHTGLYAASRNDMEWHGLAAGGSGLDAMAERRAAAIAVKPDLLSIYIGSNDLGADVDGFVARLKAYVEPIRAQGTRVIICTLLPKQVENVKYSNDFNEFRKIFNERIRAATWIDGVADFGGHPVVGNDAAPFNKVYFEADGQHLTAAGQRQIFDVYRPVMDRLFADVR